MNASNLVLRAAVIQTTPCRVKTANLEKTEIFIEKAVQSGAKLISLHETFSYSGPHSEMGMKEVAEKIPGKTSQWSVSKKFTKSIVKPRLFTAGSSAPLWVCKMQAYA